MRGWTMRGGERSAWGTATALLLVVGTLVRPDLAAAQALANPGFETAGEDGFPEGWSTGTAGAGADDIGFEVELVSAARAGARSLRLTRSEGDAPGVLSQTLDPGSVEGMRLRLSGWIRTDSLEDGFAGLWMRVDGVEASLAFDNMAPRGPRGTTPWARYQVELPVDRGARGLVVGVLHVGSGTSWFDDLSLEVVGPATDVGWDVPGVDAPPVLDGEALAVEPVVALPPERASWGAWVRENHHPVRSLTSEDFSDLAFLAPLVAGRRVVQLGESGHGVSEFDHAKVRLIKYLHGELGYDVVAFESGLWECWRANGRIGELPAAEVMKSCIFGVWHTEEVLELFRYLEETREAGRPLILAGFDAQISSRSGVTARPGWVAELVGRLDPAYAARVQRLDSTFATGDRLALAQSDSLRLRRGYDSLAAFLEDRADELVARGARREEVLVAARTARSMSAHVRQIASEGPARTETRDRAMADNLDFLLDELYPERKVITWGHNSHLRHRNTEVVERQTKTMGQWMAERRREELYTVGLYMGSGRATLNNRQVYDIAEIGPENGEAVLTQAGSRFVFVDLSRAPRVPGTEWMATPVKFKTWGQTDQTMRPADQYDALLYIHEVTPPRYR